MCSLWHGFKGYLKAALGADAWFVQILFCCQPWEAHAFWSLKEVCTSCCKSIGHLCNHLFLARGYVACKSSPQCLALPAQCRLSWGSFNSGHWAVFFQWSPVQTTWKLNSSACFPGRAGVVRGAPRTPLLLLLTNLWEAVGEHCWTQPLQMRLGLLLGIFQDMGNTLTLHEPSVCSVPQGFFRAAEVSCCHRRGPLFCPLHCTWPTSVAPVGSHMKGGKREWLLEGGGVRDDGDIS